MEREDILERLALVLGNARDGQGSLVVVSGEAGAGKTRVVQTALAGVEASWGWCEPLSVPRPLGPFRDITTLGTTAPDVGDVLVARMRSEPTIVVIEDAHWIDDAGADVIRFISRRIRPTYGLLIVTARTEIGPDHALRAALGDAPADTVRIEVPALSRAAVADLVAGSERDPDEAWRVTGGNAFLVDQLLTSVTPTSAVRDAVAARVSRLPARTRSAVRALSVVPGRALLPADDAGDLDEAVRAGIVEIDDTSVHFRHELVRRAVEADLDPYERRAAHLAAFTATADPGTAVLAYHARGAGLIDRADLLEVAAAREAALAGSSRQAAAHYRRALTSGSSGDARARLLLDLADAEWASGEDTAAAAAVAEAVALTSGSPDRLLRGTAVRWSSKVQRDDAKAEKLARAAIEVLEPLGPTPELATAVATLATVQMVARDLTRAIVTGRDAVRLARELGDPAALAVALQAFGAARTLTGADDRCRDLREAIEVAASAGLVLEQARAWANTVSAAGEAKLYATVADVLPSALTFFTSRDLDFWAGYTRAWQARCLFEQGRWSDATRWVDEVVAAPHLGAITVVTARCVQGRIRARRGDPGVWESLDEAKRSADAFDSLQRIAPVAAARAEARWLAGERDDGRDGLLHAYELACRRENPWTVGELGLWLTRHDIPHGPGSAAEPYRLHLAGDASAAGRRWWDLGCPYEAGDAWCDSTSEQDLRRALQIAHDLGAGPLRRAPRERCGASASGRSPGARAARRRLTPTG